MKIAITGTGYVGLSNGVLLFQQHEVMALDIVLTKGDMLNRKHFSIEDAELEDCFKNKPLNFRATLNKQDEYLSADLLGNLSTATKKLGWLPEITAQQIC